MIMSTLSIERHENAGSGALTRLAATALRLWLAYINWRIQRLALAELHSMSDRQLNDLGLPRSQISSAVKTGRYASAASASPVPPTSPTA
jgi:uncharacterized protein YjiS (DUF1127 family)